MRDNGRSSDIRRSQDNVQRSLVKLPINIPIEPGALANIPRQGLGAPDTFEMAQMSPMQFAKEKQYNQRKAQTSRNVLKSSESQGDNDSESQFSTGGKRV